MILSHTPTLLAASNQQEEGYKEQFNWKDFFPKRYVQIKNSMTGGEKIRLKCKTTDDELGTHTLYPGQYRKWEFRENVLSGTRLSCRVKWRQYIIRFNAWKSEETEAYCLSCFYEVTNEGVIDGRIRKFEWKPII